MNELRNWVAGVCMTLVLTGVLRLAAPSGKHAKLYQTVLALAVLCALCLPLTKGLKIETDFAQAPVFAPASSEELGETVRRQAAELAAARLWDEARPVLEGLGVRDAKFSLETTTDEAGRICINKAAVTLSREDAARAPAVREALRAKLGLETEVRVLE